jgi:hypothetical protein
VYAYDGVVTVLVDVYGTGSPNLALELDGDGEVIARQVLSLRRREAEEDDGFEDFGEEEPLAYLNPYSEGARPAKVCECPVPRHDDGTCGICGHVVPVDAQGVAQAA